MLYSGSNREDFVFVRPPGVERFVLNPDNVWYGRLKLLFSISVKTDGSDEVKKIDCAYVFFSTISSWILLVTMCSNV